MLLDEPTNNLGFDARQRLYHAIASWHGVLVVVSHDRELLARVERIAEVSGDAVLMYGGNLEAYEELVAAEQAAAERAVTSAAAALRRERRDLVEAQVKQARRDRQGRRMAASGSIPRIVAGGSAHVRRPVVLGACGRSGLMVRNPERPSFRKRRTTRSSPRACRSAAWRGQR